MCFNKSSSSSAQETKSTTIQRDERLAGTDSATVLSAKEGGSIVNYNLAPEIVKDAVYWSAVSAYNADDFAYRSIDRALNTVNETSEDAFRFSELATERALNAVIEGGEDALRFAGDIFNSAIGAVHETSEQAGAFVSSTQAQFADARETDTKQLLEQLVKIVAIGTAGLVAYQVMK